MNRVLNPSVNVKSGFTKIPNFILQNKRIKLNDSQARFLLYIFGNIYSKTGYAELSLSDITSDLGYSKSKISKLRKELIQLGLISTAATKTKGNGYGPTLYYLLDIDNLDAKVNEGKSVQVSLLNSKQECTNKSTNLVPNSEHSPCTNYDTSCNHESICESMIEARLKEEQIQEEFEKEQQEQNVVVDNKLKDNKNSKTEVNLVLPNNDNGNTDKLIEELRKLHVTENAVNKIISTNKPLIISEYINYVSYLLQNKKIHNPAAFLVKAINENYDISNYKIMINKEKQKTEYIEKQIEINKQDNYLKQEKKKEHLKLQMAIELYESMSENDKIFVNYKLEEVVTNKYGKIKYGKELLKQIELKELLEKHNWEITNLSNSELYELKVTPE